MAARLWALKINGDTVLNRLYTEAWRATASAAMNNQQVEAVVPVRVLGEQMLDHDTVRACAAFLEGSHPEAAAALSLRLSQIEAPAAETGGAPARGA